VGAAHEDAEYDGWELEPDVGCATSEITRRGVSLLQRGQCTLSLLAKRTSFSNFSPQLGQSYS
jgi:hypothetical protein